MTHPATRKLTLILLLERQPNRKAADLAKILSVSVCTVHRYFNQLDEMGIPNFSRPQPARRIFIRTWI